MSRSNEFSASTVPRPGELSQADIPQAQGLRDVAGERRQERDSSPQTGNPLSVDDIDEQIRVFFAKGLA